MPRPDRGRGPALPRAAQSRSRAVFRLAALPGALGPLCEPHVLGPAVVRWRQVSPLERPLLAVVLAEREREPRLHELAAEVERVRRLVDAELREDLVDVRAPHEDLVVEDGDDFAIREVISSLKTVMTSRSAKIRKFGSVTRACSSRSSTSGYARTVASLSVTR